MISSYSEDTRVYMCFFTREEYDALVDLVCAGCCSFNNVATTAKLNEYRTLRYEIYSSYVKP